MREQKNRNIKQSRNYNATPEQQKAVLNEKIPSTNNEAFVKNNAVKKKQQPVNDETNMERVRAVIADLVMEKSDSQWISCKIIWDQI